VRILRALFRRLSGGEVRALRAEVAAMRADVAEMHRVLMDLNHEVRAGSESALPLFLGHAERLRLDADAAVAATMVIERHLARLDGDAGADRTA
jgi:hypothetical protein